MLISWKIQIFAFFVISATFPLNFVSSVSAPKVKRATQTEFNTFAMQINQKMDALNARMDRMELKGNNDTLEAVREMMTKMTTFQEKLFNKMEKFEENLIEIEEIEENNLKNREKFENNFSKMAATVSASDGGVSEWCHSTCRDKVATWANATDTSLDHINRCLTMQQTTTKPPTTQPPTTTSPITVCHPNPCLHGGRCQTSPTGSGYQCVCSKFTSGSHCETVECTVDNKCWRLKNTLYIVIETEITWAEAKVKCESLNMTLAMPKDQERTQFLHDQLKPIYSAQKYLWIGIKRDAGGSGWFWVDGSALGEYTGGVTYMKSATGSYFGLLSFYGVSQMWSWDDATYQWYALCEANLISH